MAGQAGELDREADLESQRVEVLDAHTHGVDMGVSCGWGDIQVHPRYLERNPTELDPQCHQ